MANFPVDGQTNVPLNKQFKHSFTEALNPESIFSGSVVMYDATSDTVVDGVYGYEPDTFTITFLSDKALNTFTTYVWSFAGEDAEDSVPLELENGDPLPLSVSISFQTGESVISDSNPDGDIEELDVIQDGQTLDERNADLFRVIDTNPDHMKSGIDVLTDTIQIVFNNPVKAGQDFAVLITLQYEPLLRETYYFNNDKFKTNVIDKIPGKTTLVNGAESFIMPTGTWVLSLDAKTLTWTKTAGQLNFNANAFVRVTISKNLLSASDQPLNGKQDEFFYFLTQLFPLFSTLQSTLLMISSIEGAVSEEVVLKYLLKHSLDAWFLANRVFPLEAPHRAATKYAECATIISLIDNKTIARDINRGKKIVLADLSIEFGFPRAPQVDISSVRTECSKLLWEVKQELSCLANNYSFVIGDKGRNAGVVHDVYRNRLRFYGDLGMQIGSVVGF